MNLNRVIIAGRLTADPQLRTTTGGQPVCSFGLATSRAWTDKAGQKQEQTEFHNVVVWGRTGEVSAQYLKKGSLALVEGRLQTRAWEDQQGGKRKTTEVIAETVQFGPRQDGGGSPRPQAPAAAAAPAAGKDQEEPFSDPNEIPIINLDEDEAMTSEIPF